MENTKTLDNNQRDSIRNSAVLRRSNNSSYISKGSKGATQPIPNLPANKEEEEWEWEWQDTEGEDSKKPSTNFDKTKNINSSISQIKDINKPIPQPRSRSTKRPSIAIHHIKNENPYEDNQKQKYFHYIPYAKKLIEKNKQHIWTLDNFNKYNHQPSGIEPSFMTYKEPIKHHPIRMLKETKRPEYTFPLKYQNNKKVNVVEDKVDSKLTENILNSYLGFNKYEHTTLEALNFPHPTVSHTAVKPIENYNATKHSFHTQSDAHPIANKSINDNIIEKSHVGSKNNIKAHSMSKYGLIAIGILLDNSSLKIKHFK